ncbi:hypothetical protein [Leptospira borgpetersenii]|uniref:Uncharacterized protein n=4 Tax=Leptospira borgpetersenii TaxID=174 RepID=M3FJS4_LEPBO|nr:hypothetical protein [Leptospira borgpetersenii]EMG02068.1 hypothetical protein LEP1GSC123_4388 [Leptospira borgpetersenii str. 200701203]EMO12057.1 hypothetical protein LEP1GSC137_0844 [Leptospira borgpetersenii str. Noumea 25]ALO26206.1 hypothetical protein LBBP_01931 [Leptospira borgpetersenii serovar Ballum]ANH00908.1 Uncharacterized protein LB4E_1553 [Leptospira borgpetersenii str. 4E]EKP12696.1 hypothetical protein LEP1GSC128_3056 [Leptospira borgpetersenii str. 200801926]
MQFAETKKRTALAKRTAFRRKAFYPLNVGVPTSEGLGQVFSYNLSENAIYRATIEARC